MEQQQQQADIAPNEYKHAKIACDAPPAITLLYTTAAVQERDLQGAQSSLLAQTKHCTPATLIQHWDASPTSRADYAINTGGTCSPVAAVAVSAAAAAVALHRARHCC
jgi:hypothetical protein